MTTEEILQDLEQTKTDVMNLEGVCQYLRAYMSECEDEERMRREDSSGFLLPTLAACSAILALNKNQLQLYESALAKMKADDAAMAARN